ncbi:MAG: bifunctional DNA primase/helicase, partial [Dolichospermum sp.]
MKIPKTKPLDLTGQGLAVKINLKSVNGTDKNNYSNIHYNCQASHYQELLNSGIDPDVIALNFKSLEGDVTHEYLLSDALAKFGNGKQTPHSSQYVTSEVARYYKIYAHTLAGGWYCSGVDPLNNYESMQWGCFKPDFPRLDPKKNKFIKYE